LKQSLDAEILEKQNALVEHKDQIAREQKNIESIKEEISGGR
jgi:hypothetical protein